MVRILAATAALAAVGLVCSPGPAAAATDGERVRAVLRGMNDAYNRFDFDTFATYVCAAMRHDDGFEPSWYSSRRIDGPTSISVGSVSVAGDPATSAIATVRFAAAHHTETLAVEFVREGTQWKACRYRALEAI